MKKKDKFTEMTQRPIPGLILSLGLPTTITMLVTSLYNLVDTYFVSSLGTSESAAIGIVFALMSVIQAFGFMLGQGAGSNIARLLGARNIKKAGKFASISFFTALLCGAMITILGLVFIKPFMRLLGSTETILPYAVTYGKYILIAAPAMLAAFTMNNILRFEGKAAIGMIGVTAGGILNIFGDALFMFVFKMGIAGAGLSTALSQYISTGILLYMFLSGKTQTRLSVSRLKEPAKEMLSIIQVGMPSLVRQGLGSVSAMLLNRAAAQYGDSAIAAMSIVSRVTMFIFCVGLGIGQGFQPVAGFNYGAKKYSRVKQGFYFTLIVGTAILGLFSICGLTISGHIIGFFRDEASVIEFGTIALRAQCIALFFVPMCVCGNMMFQSIGKSAYATLLSTLRNGICFIPAILIMPQLLGKIGIQLAQPIADVCSAVLTAVLVIPFIRKLPKDGEEGQEK